MKPDTDKATSRYLFIFGMMTLVALVIVWSAARKMTPDERRYWEKVGQSSKQDKIPADRGSILAADGQVISGTVPKYDLRMDFRVADPDTASARRTREYRDTTFWQKLDSIAEGLAQIFPDKDAKWFKDNLIKGKKSGRWSWKVYPKQASYIQYKACKELPFLRESKFKSGFYGDEVLMRIRPYGGLAARTIGDLYRDSAQRAKCGLEMSYDSILRGQHGLVHYTNVRRTRVPIIDKPAINGHDILTTLDLGIQDIADRALRNKLHEVGGAEIGVAIVMETKTGDVKAAVNLMRSDDGEFYEMRNVAVSDLMEPGSTFKTASIMVALDDGKIDTSKVVDCVGGIYDMHGRKMKDHNWNRGGYGMLKVEDILGQSSNIGVSRIIDEAYSSNPSAYVDGLRRIGVGIPLDLPFVGSGDPIVPHPKSKTRYWSRTDLAWMSIGYVTMLPPISTLTFYNAIANNGRMMKPRYVTAELEDGHVVREFPPVVIKESICKQETLGKIQYCLEHVVSGGLGKKAGNGGKYFKVSGKTGTAQFSENGSYAGHKYMVSFCGYFPSDAPKYSCIVCIKKQGLPASGGGQCGPVFSEISQYIMARDMDRSPKLARDTTAVFTPSVAKGDQAKASAIAERMGVQTAKIEATDTLSIKKVPDVLGMGLKDAVYELRKRGLKVNTTGKGYVTKQSIKPGSDAIKGTTVTLTLEV